MPKFYRKTPQPNDKCWSYFNMLTLKKLSQIRNDFS